MIDLSRRLPSIAATVVIYLLSIGIYLHPLTSSPTPSEFPNNKQRWKLIYSPQPQLDELHIMSTDNHDIYPQPTSSWTDAWYNDYWGRPFTYESSHKSWRPVSVWSFRFGKGGEIGRRLIANVGIFCGTVVESSMGLFGKAFRNRGEIYNTSLDYNGRETLLASELFVHRFINVLIHAAIVQVVGVVTTLLFANNRNSKQFNLLQLYTKCIPQILFAVHPVHVEAVVNVANRPHILALLFNVTCVDPSVPLVGMAALCTLGLLTAETAIFQFPAIALTMTAIRYRELLIVEKKNGKTDDTDEASQSTETSSPHSQKPHIVNAVISLLPRYILLVMIALTYLLYRHYNDTLSIPKGLIRPAENPFYDNVEKGEWTLARRAMNYSYILSLHIMKSFGVEIVGFSHEYGFECIPEILTMKDFRLALPLVLMFVFGGMVAWSLHGWKKREERVQRIILILVFFSWMATLFPISGILKVGTFVADRIAVASSFGTSIFGGRCLAVWITGDQEPAEEDTVGRANRLKRRYNALLLSTLIVHSLAKHTHRRAAQWMDSVPLYESSLAACPRSIKSNLEMSKLYSGLIPHMSDLEKAL